MSRSGPTLSLSGSALIGRILIRIRPLVFKENCHQKGKEAEGHKHWSTKPCCFVSSSLKVTSK